MAGKVVWHVTMSLDGFIAGPDDEMSWVFEHHGQPDAADGGETAQFGAMADEVIKTTGAFMSGGRLYHDIDSFPNGKNLVVTGGSVPRQCIEAGLVDEIVVHVVPVLLGEGVRFYDNPGVDRVVLERTRLAQSRQLTDLRFRVVKE